MWKNVNFLCKRCLKCAGILTLVMPLPGNKFQTLSGIC